MKFTVTHSRAFAGTDITVEVLAEGHEEIASVSISLDGRDLDSSQPPPHEQDYKQEFAGVGSAGPGEQHELLITVLDGEGQPHACTASWQDPG